MGEYECKECNNVISVGEFIIVHREKELYFCTFECEAEFIFKEYGREKTILSSDVFQEDEREEYILSHDDLEQ